MQGVWVQSLVRELRHHMPHDQNQNRINIVTNSIKTFKISHIKKKKNGWKDGRNIGRKNKWMNKISEHVCMGGWIMDGWWMDEWITVSGTNTENQIPGGTSVARVETDRNLVDSFTIFPSPIYHLRWPQMTPPPQSSLKYHCAASLPTWMNYYHLSHSHTGHSSFNTTILGLPLTHHLCVLRAGRVLCIRLRRDKE